MSEMGGRACLIDFGIYLHTHSLSLNIYCDICCYNLLDNLLRSGVEGGVCVCQSAM